MASPEQNPTVQASNGNPGRKKALAAVASVVVLGGIAYDMHGDYAYLLIGGIAGSLLSAAMILTLGPYPDWSEGKESGRQAPAGP